ncbi:hypothetical protein ALC56_06995, partial [Trachymyrmex septentrionalis]
RNRCGKVKYRVGDFVRISRAKGAFEKGYQVKWRKVIDAIFYEQELARVGSVILLEKLNGVNFYSNHPLTQKKGTICSLVNRAFLLSDVMFHTKNLTFIINILLDNDYPMKFIFDTINQRIKNLIKNRYKVHNVLTDNVCVNEITSWLTVPYIPRHTEKFRRFNKNDIRIFFHTPTKWVNT